MAERYPGYDVLAKRRSPSWDEVTRRVVARRLAVASAPRFFSGQEWPTITAICERILPQPAHRPPVPIAALIDDKLFGGHLDGYRRAELPPQGEAWRRGLAATDAEAKEAHGRAFHELTAADRDRLLRAMQAGRLRHAAWQGMPCDVFFAHRVLTDITRAYYAHPAAWNEIGFGGPASPRGYVRLAFGRRDPWESFEAQPGREARASAENRRANRR